MRILLTGFILGLSLWVPQAAAQPHPAEDSVKTLEQKGVLKGYPDGQTRGNRSITRDELAQQLERLEALLSRQQQNYASKASFEAVQSVAEALYKEYDAVDTRVEQLERSQDHLRQRSDQVR